ncbi:ATP-binding protein [Kordiimonas aquimaris]|uniref:ATP-binding protein n=1 Tax=Kordiimonas aquimaris TaxID=707591 RepID=UPI0021CE23BC|nr:ATP-binding protein [Kordiimonas aquimaris]
MILASKLRMHFVFVLMLLSGFLFGAHAANAENTPLNLLPSACHFETDSIPKFPSMLEHLSEADCKSRPQQSQKVVWLSLDVDQIKPKVDTDYELAILRHWTERAIIQFHYADGYMLDYDVGAYDFDTYWSVGNYVTFPAPARASPVQHILVGFENASSIKLFHEISFTTSQNWQVRKTSGILLTMIITGILLAMLFYNVALATVLRFNFHFHYCLVVFAALTYNIVNYGFLSYLAPGLVSYSAQMNITILALGLNGLAGLLFLCSFLEEGILTSRWKQVARTLGYSFLGLAIVFVNMRGPYTETLETGLHVVSFVGVLFVFAALVRAIKMHSQAAIFYAVGWLLPVIGVLVRNMREFGVIQHSDMVGYSVSIGIALETVIFAVGIAHRISKIRNERDIAELESAKAKAANQAKTDFVTHMSHEVRNPINAIIVLSDLMSSTTLDKNQRQFMHNIQKSSSVLMDLLDDTLDFSKIEAGKVSIEKINFAIKDVLDNVRAVISPKADEKSIAFVIEGENALPQIMVGDPTRLSQILINLSSNAVKFTAEGSVSVSLSYTSINDTSGKLRCEVTDTGIGMTEQQISNLFQSYNQADDTVTRKYGGTGLGLAICKQLVELMGGEIGVTSIPNRGSTFYFEMPFSVSLDNEHINTDTANCNTTLLGDIRILVVDDNTVNHLLVSKILDRANAQNDLASSGEEAINMANTNQYDIILMDVNMPDMNGMEATQIIRSQQKNKLVPIIAMTGSNDLETQQACRDAGMDDHLSKPFKPTTILSAIEKWLPEQHRKEHHKL